MAVLGIDIGGTKTIVGVADSSGKIFSSRRIETSRFKSPDENIAAIKEAAKEAVRESSQAIEMIGIGCGGPLDRKSGTLYKVANLPGWEGLCLTKIFGSEFDLPAYLDNDATAAAIGEWMFGAGRGYDNFVYFTISTGIGGGIIADGKVYRGHCENAGEFGHQKIVPNGPPCLCGDSGCLEALASGTSIARIAREGLSKHPESILWKWVSSPKEVTAELVAKATSRGDLFASEIWWQAMHYLGLGIVNVVNIINPGRVILGGGVTKAEDLLFEPVRKIVKERAMQALVSDLEIVPAQNGDMTGLLGAVALAIEQSSCK